MDKRKNSQAESPEHYLYVSDSFIKQTGVEFRMGATLKQLLSLKEIHPDDVDKFKNYLSRWKEGKS